MALLSGCAAFQITSPGPTPVLADADRIDVVFRDRIEHGYVIILPGVAGSSHIDHGLAIGLRHANIDAAIEMYDWTNGNGDRVHTLQATHEAREQAQRVAERILAYQSRFPGRPVHLVGYSGGAAVAVFALEALPPDCQVTSVSLLGAVLAPDYDLTVAMQRTAQSIHSFNSPFDVAALVVCTTMLGTMEGRHCWSAGSVGFSPPENTTDWQRALYAEKLVQHCHDSKMLESGHVGGHYGWANPWFVSRWVAPIIDAPAPAIELAAQPVTTPLR